MDEEAGFPDLALNDHRVDRIVLDGVTATPIEESDGYRSKTLNLWGMKTGDSIELVVEGPGDERAVSGVFEGFMDELRWLCGR